MNDAYFISPTAELIETEGTHVRTVLDYPEKFGFSKQYLLDIYSKYKEKLGIEGKAREEILTELLDKGWIRVRFYPTKSFWSIQLKRIDKKIENILYKFANMIKDKKVSKQGSLYDILNIHSFKTNQVYSLTVQEILEGKLFELLEKKLKNKYLEQVDIKKYNQYLPIKKIENYHTQRRLK